LDDFLESAAQIAALLLVAAMFAVCFDLLQHLGGAFS
jgi:hypothetical protein